MIGKLLVAHPSILGDQSFGRSVILMASHDENGALGFIINQHTHYSLEDLLPEFGMNIPVFQGGPVDQDRLFFLHTCPTITGAQPLGNDLFWGGELEELKMGILTQKIPSNQLKCILGYSGWSKGQLEEEQKGKSWLLVPNKYNLFSHEEELWGTILREMGGELAIYSFAPTHPGLN